MPALLLPGGTLLIPVETEDPGGRPRPGGDRLGAPGVREVASDGGGK